MDEVGRAAAAVVGEVWRGAVAGGGLPASCGAVLTVAAGVTAGALAGFPAAGGVLVPLLAVRTIAVWPLPGTCVLGGRAAVEGSIGTTLIEGLAGSTMVAPVPVRATP